MRVAHLPLAARAAVAAVVAVAFSLGAAPPAQAAVPLTKVSTDPYIDPMGQHATEVEPDTLSFGNTVVAAFQVGRVNPGGATNIGWATSKDAGATWKHGFLPGTTANTGGPWTKVTDPSVAYSRRYNTWQISFMGITGNPGPGTHVLTSRSTDGGLTWSAPVVVVSGVGQVDKNWTVCDNQLFSPFYGRCYTTFSNHVGSWVVRATTSSDGGASWSAPVTPAGGSGGFTGSSVVRPDGTVVVAHLTADQQAIRAFRSTNGGMTWTSSVHVANTVDNVTHFRAPAPLRDWPLPSLDVDAAGRVYAAWSSCQFRAGCATNDIVISESVDGVAWPTPYRVPLDAPAGVADHYLPGLAVAPGTSGDTARLALTYVFLDSNTCTTSCRLVVGFSSSVNGGKHWSVPTRIQAMSLGRFPLSGTDRMIGDYLSTSIVAGRAHPVVSVARTPAPGKAFDVGMYHPTGGLPITGGPLPAN